MKLQRRVLGLGLVVLGLAGCGSREEVAAPPAVPPPEGAPVAAGEGAADALGAALMAELRSAMTEGGPAAGVRVCSERAPAIAAELLAERAEFGVKALRRVGVRTRQPANAPDEEDLRALEHFGKVAPMAPPPGDGAVGMGHWARLDEGWRFYRPIHTQGMCLICHGPPEGLTAEVREILDERYPLDEATGFLTGELRGLFVVELSETGEIGEMSEAP